MDVQADRGLRGETERMRLAWAEPARGSERTVVALGDSITYGWGLPYASSYPALLERLLNQGGTGTERWRVINAGVPGDTVLCAERRYERDVACWQADALLVGLGLNDAALRRTPIDAQRERLWLALRYPWVRWGLRVERALRRMGGKPSAPVELEHQLAPRVRPGIYTRALTDLIRRAQASGMRVYLLSLALLAWEQLAAGQAAWYRYYDDLIQQVARSCAVPCIDLSSPRQAEPDAGYWQDDGIHLTAEGQAWLARCVGERLRRDERDL